MNMIVYELNEVPKKLFDFYAVSHPKSAFATLRNRSQLFQTYTADIGNLSPWITWPTMHRGVSNVDHEISDLGQDLTYVNREFPNVYNILAKNGVRVGVFGSLQSYPLPESLDNFAFYVPDTFAAGDECFPSELSVFQAFNLSMVRANSRNVQSGIAINGALQFIKKSLSLGLTGNTFLKLSNQLLRERINSDRLVRRRTSQVEIAFDLYFEQLQRTRPDISFFFTNHVASSMHRYWPTVFPEDYEEGKFDHKWRKRWSGEIPHAIKVANFQLHKLLNYCNQTNTELVVCSSMGQGAVTDVLPVQNQVLITNLKRLLSFIGIESDEWEPRLAMAPLVIFAPKSEEVKNKLKRLDNILVNGQPIHVFITSSGDIRLSIGMVNQSSLSIFEGSKKIEPKEIGIDNINLQDASGSYAYHIPEGILLHYIPSQKINLDINRPWRSVSALDFTPSILEKFGLQIPSYMQKENLFLSKS